MSSTDDTPRRILFFYPWQQIDTGSPKAMVSVMEMLDRERFEPLFLATGSGPLVDVLRERGIAVLEGPVGPVSPRRPFRALAHIDRQAKLLSRERIDALHINSLGYNFDLVLAAWRLKIPVVLHIHNPVSIQFRNLHRLVASRVLTVSKAMTETIPDFDRVRHKHAVLYNAIDIERFAAGKNIRNELGLEDDAFVVATVAQVSHRKGIDIFIEVAERLVARHPELVFLVVGPDAVSENDFAAQMHKRVSDAGLDRSVRFLGSRSDIPDVLASVDVFMFPTRAEPFGIAIIEAMAAGLPVIASRVGGIPEIIASTELGTLVDPVDADAFASALSEVLKRPDRGRQMGQNGRESLQNRFSTSTIARQVNALYEDLIGASVTTQRRA